MSNETALAKIESAEKNGALVFFDRNNGIPQVELYRAEITVINIDKDKDCFLINKKYMPKREKVDQIGEAAGIIFTKGDTGVLTVDDPICGRHNVYVGSAQGKVRMSDGTWRMSSICDYEFDPTVRAMSDFKVAELNAETKKKRKGWEGKDGTKKEYGNTLAEAILEYQKTARQRANTGARLRVIRELTGMPIAFDENEIKKPVVFGRIVQNTSYILSTPAGQALATAQALGVDMSTIFGGQKLLDSSIDQQKDQFRQGEETASAEATPPANNEPDFPDDSSSQTESEFVNLTIELEQLMASYESDLNVTSGNGKNPFKMAQEELADPNATEESRRSMRDRLKNYLKQKGIDV